jgi:uncharacterized protein YndB with AHSA1/START domain/predicted enzyme related to lactoylglutathione lyase
MTQSATTVPALVIRRMYDAPRERVYAAWTNPELAAQFLGPVRGSVAKVDMDVRTGGAFRIVMSHRDGEDWAVGGVYREVVAPQRLSMTWRWEEDDPKDEYDSLLTIELFDRDGKTELVLTHELLPSIESRDRHTGGWNAVLDQLAGTLAGSVRVAGIDLSGYMVKDAARAIAFYRDVFGLEPTKIYPEDRGAEYELPDGSTFGLWGGGGKVMPFQPSNGILFAVNDFDGSVAALKQRGIPIVFQNETPNCYMAMINDTEGNSITLHKRKG